MRKKCEMCGQVFEPRSGNQRYCSFVCTHAAQLVRRNRWNEQNRDYYREYYRRRRKPEKTVTS